MQHLPLLFEFSRHAYPRLHVSACGLLKGLFLEGGVDAAAALQVRALEQTRGPRPPAPTWRSLVVPLTLQAAGLEWGALVWHLRWAVAPAAGDDAFALPSPAERLLCERLWADCGVPLGAEGVAGGGRAGLGACCAHGPLIDGPEGSGVVATGWSATAPAARGVHLVHRLAREASRELVAVLCFRNAAATAAVERVLPAGLAPALRSPTTRQAGGSVSLFDAGVAPGTASSAAAVEESAVAPAGVARAPVPSTCDESMFTSPRARVVYVAAPAATASPGKGPKKQSQQKQAQGGQPGGDAAVASWLSTALWSGDADVPVALGRSGCLWWDAALCSPAANRAQRQAVAARVKVAWLGVEPQSRASHTGPSAAALEGDAAATAVTDGSTEAAPPPPPTPAASSGNASRYEPTILVVQVRELSAANSELVIFTCHGAPCFSRCRRLRATSSGAPCGGLYRTALSSRRELCGLETACSSSATGCGLRRRASTGAGARRSAARSLEATPAARLGLHPLLRGRPWLPLPRQRVSQAGRPERAPRQSLPQAEPRRGGPGLASRTLLTNRTWYPTRALSEESRLPPAFPGMPRRARLPTRRLITFCASTASSSLISFRRSSQRRGLRRMAQRAQRLCPPYRPRFLDAPSLPSSSKPIRGEGSRSCRPYGY